MPMFTHNKKENYLKSFKHAGLQRKLTETKRSKEKILWLFEDAQGTLLYKMLIVYGLVFTLIWCFFAFSIVNPALAQPATLLILLLFPGVGVIQVVFLAWAFLRRNKFSYVVTTQRVILMNSLGSQFIRSLGPDQLMSLSRSGTDQKGTIKLSSDHTPWDWTGGLLSFFLPAKIANIPNAKQVEELIYENLAGPENRRIKAVYPNRKPNHFHGY